MFIAHNIRKKWWKEYTYTVLAESYRDSEKKKSRRKTIANISYLPAKTISTLKASLQEDKNSVLLNNITIKKTIDYWNILVLLKIMDKLKIDKVIKKVYPERSELAILMIIWKIVTRWSKLSILNWIKRNEIITEKLWINTQKLTEKDLYSVMHDIDSLQEKIEHKWFLYNKKKTNTIFLYDVTSHYFEWKQNELSAYGYNRDKKTWKKIITVWLITNENGFPLKIKTFKWNILDHQTVKWELESIKTEFNTENIIFVWDRWMRIRLNLENMEEEKKQWIKYITWLTTSEIRSLANDEVIQFTLFDKKLVEVEHDNKRYILCENPELAKEKWELRAILKTKFDLEIANIQERYRKVQEKCKNNKKRLQEWDKNKNLKIEFTDKEIENMKYKIKKYQEKYKMKKVYTITITKKKMQVEYNPLAYEELWKYDWKYVFETTVKKEELTKEEVRYTYKRLQDIEHAFKDMKTSRLNMRPIFHTKQETTRAHILLWMFSYAIINEMEWKIFPWLKENRSRKWWEKLSFNDIMEELKMIKLSILSFWKWWHQEVRISELNEKQRKILELLELDAKKLEF